VNQQPEHDSTVSGVASAIRAPGSRGHRDQFDGEKPAGKVKSACTTLGIPYPVALDNDYATWDRYGTRYWPTLHLIDKKGIVRHTRIGEGGYAEMEAMIRRLLEES